MVRDNYIGSYRILKLVRAGSSCQIWEVISELDNQRCALKTLNEEHRKSRDEIALLKQEYMVGSDLNHPHVIRIFDFNTSKGIPYLALEYFDSSNLKQWLRREIDQDQRRQLLGKIVQGSAKGLEHVHDRGWIHRDIKPDNFLVDNDGFVKLIDFAIAQKEKKGFSRFLSGRNKIQGTRSYMSPEQIRGEHLDARSDIYSYGCMMFELFCLRPPFTGGSPDELLQKHLKAPVPSVLASNSDVHPDFAELITSMMSKDRSRRPESMKDVLKATDGMRLFRAQRG